MKSHTHSTRDCVEIRCSALKSALVGFGKVVPSGTKSHAKETGLVKVEPQSKNAVQMTATDLNVTLRLDVPARSHAKCAPFLVPLTQLREMVRRRAAADTITISPMAKAPETTSFPEHNSWRATAVVPLRDEAVCSLLRAFQCGSRDQTRYVLQGAYLDVDDKGKNAHRIVATDGRQLFSSNSMHLPNLKQSIILPAHKLWKWKALAESRPWTLRIGKAKAKQQTQPFRIDRPFWSVSGTVIDGKYPNYRQVIPAEKEFKTRILLSKDTRETMAGLLPQLPGAKAKHGTLGIQLRDKQLFLLARDNAEQPWQPHPLGSCEVRGPNTTVQINRDYLMRFIDFDLEEIAIIDEMSPLRFRRDGDLMIVMPLRPLGNTDVAPLEASPPPPSRPKLAKRSKRKTAPHHDIPTAKKKATRRKAPTREPEADPIVAAEAQIAEARQALAGARKGLISANNALKSARRKQRESDKEVRGVRRLLQRQRKHEV